MKKGLKVMAATTAAAMLLSMSMSAMAAEYFTTTEYAVEDGKDVVNVETTVYSLKGTEQVSYLVHADADAVGDVDDSEIVYIDQAFANEATEISFGFKADYAKLANSKADVLIASDDAEDFTVKADAEGNVLADKKVTFSAEGGMVYVDADALEADDATTKADEVTFYLVPEAGYTVTGATVSKNGADAEAVISEVYTAEVAHGDDFAFTFAAIDESAAPDAATVDSSAVKDGYTANKFEAASETRRQFTLFGSAAGAKEFGILVAAVEFEKPATVEELNALISQGKAVKLAAKGASAAGKFAISLYEEKEGDNFTTSLRNDNIYACVYAINGNNLAVTDVVAYGLN